VLSWARVVDNVRWLCVGIAVGTAVGACESGVVAADNALVLVESASDGDGVLAPMVVG